MDNNLKNSKASSASEHLRLYRYDSTQDVVGTDTNSTKKVKLTNGMSFNHVTKSNPKKQLLLFIAVFLAVSTITTVIALVITPENTFDMGIDANEVASISVPSDNYGIGSKELPKLVNIPPANAYIGEKYNFTMRIADADTDIQNIYVTIQQGPDWLTIDGFTLSGIPLEDSGFSDEIILKLYDGENSVEESFYIFVSESKKTPTVVYPDDEIKYELHD